jgi:hypothetical protein
MPAARFGLEAIRSRVQSQGEQAVSALCPCWVRMGMMEPLDAVLKVRHDLPHPCCPARIPARPELNGCGLQDPGL